MSCAWSPSPPPAPKTRPAPYTRTGARSRAGHALRPSATPTTTACADSPRPAVSRSDVSTNGARRLRLGIRLALAAALRLCAIRCYAPAIKPPQHTMRVPSVVASHTVAVSVQTVRVGTDDPHRPPHVRRPVSLASGTIDVAVDRDARRVVRIALTRRDGVVVGDGRRIVGGRGRKPVVERWRRKRRWDQLRRVPVRGCPCVA